MKYLALLLILLLSFTFVAAETCNSYCEAEGYESGTCRAANEDTYEFCESDETIYGTFDQCDTGSFERCCCSGEVEEEEEETSETTEEEVIDEATQCKLVQLNIEKEDLPIIIFFELLLVVVILALVAVFRGPRSHQFE
jgi:hypothetical protein